MRKFRTKSSRCPPCRTSSKVSFIVLPEELFTSQVSSTSPLNLVLQIINSLILRPPRRLWKKRGRIEKIIAKMFTIVKMNVLLLTLIYFCASTYGKKARTQKPKDAVTSTSKHFSFRNHFQRYRAVPKILSGYIGQVWWHTIKWCVNQQPSLKIDWPIRMRTLSLCNFIYSYFRNGHTVWHFSTSKSRKFGFKTLDR